MSEPSTYFDLFGLPAGYEIDEARLHRSWLERQQEFHPDRHQNLPLAQRRQAVDAATTVSAELNASYQALKDPVKRAVYLLELKGCLIDEQTTASDTAFLEQMMEAQMELDELSTSKDAARLGSFLALIEQRRRGYERRLAELFADDAYRFGEDRHLQAIKNCVLEYRFVARLLEQGRARLRGLS